MARIPDLDPVTVEDAVIAPDTVLCQTPWCVVREQRDECLVYNSRTDELHLITPVGRYIYLLCDGLRTVAEIQSLLEPADNAAIPDFLAKLVTRGLAESLTAPGGGGGAR